MVAGEINGTRNRQFRVKGEGKLGTGRCKGIPVQPGRLIVRW